MAFTEPQKTLAYELLELFQGGTFDWFEYNDRIAGVSTSVPFTAQINFTVATTRLEAIFTAIEAGSDGREARIITILDEYECIALDTTSIKTGGGGGAAGARFNPFKGRRHLKKLLMINLGIRVRKIGLGEGQLTSSTIIGSIFR